MALAVWQASVTDEAGNILQSAQVEVRRESSGALAAIYADREGQTPLDNPFAVDDDGFARFYARGGSYRVIASNGGSSKTWRHQAVGLQAESDYPDGDIRLFGADPSGAQSSEAAFGNAYGVSIAPPSLMRQTYQVTTDHDKVLVSFGTPKISGGGSVDIRDITKFLKNERQKAGRMELIAHRGFRNQGTQNTLIAFSMALRRGADSLECDVQVSSNGVLYTFHDLTVDSLTDGSGTFTALSSATINSLTFDANAGTDFASVGIPTFASVLSLARKAGVRIYPEIKAYRTQADIELMVEAIEDAGMHHLCCLQSFEFSDLEYVRSLSSEIGVGYVGDSTTEETYQEAIQDLADLGNASLTWDHNALLSTPAIIDYAYRRGVEVVAWTVNDSTKAANLMELGVYKIMSDISLAREA